MLKIRSLVTILMLFLAFPCFAQAATTAVVANKPVQLCGWLENPSPNNVWLKDRKGEWTISIQGGYQAEGDWPEFPDRDWVSTNRSYGYGCTCLRASVDTANMRITRIFSARVKPLSVCRNDKLLTKPDDE